MENITVQISQSPEDIARCHEIRRVVFIEGQGVDAALEVDGRDPLCTHILAWDGDQLLGCARMRLVDGCAKAERVAVLSSSRGKGIGRVLMRALEAEAQRQGCSKVKLAAQVPVIAFYERIGYTAHGDVFMEAGIAHRWMTILLEGSAA